VALHTASLGYELRYLRVDKYLHATPRYLAPKLQSKVKCILKAAKHVPVPGLPCSLQGEQTLVNLNHNLDCTALHCNAWLKS
jgi:hypothetical protein